MGWRYDSRNRAIFADRGARHRFNIGYTVPGSDVEYWTASYDYLQFLPIWGSLTLMFNLDLAYGRALGDTTALGVNVMLNWVGELPAAAPVLSEPRAHWHDYGKSPRAGRKVGHATLCAFTAGEMIERLAVRDPRRYASPASRLALGRYFLKMGADARQVLEIFYDPIVKSYPEFVDAHLASAELSLAKYDNALAAEVLAKAPDAAKDNADYYYLLARAYAEDRTVDLLAIDQALTRLEGLDARCGRIMHLTCFTGLTREEIAGMLGISVPTVDRELRFARAWLNKALAGDD